MCHVSSFMRRPAQCAVAFVAGFSVLAGCTDDGGGGRGPGQKAEGTLPVAGSYVVDGGTDQPQDVRVAVHGVRRIDGATVLDWSVTPLAGGTLKAGDPVDQEIDINVAPGLGNSNALGLVDIGAHKFYRPLDNDEKVVGCLCVPWFMVDDDLTIGKTRMLQAAFPELPGAAKVIAVSIQNQPIVTGVTVTPMGKVPTGPGEDLDAAAKDLPQAADPQSFTYPMADPLEDPSQKMSLVVNEVISSSKATSLVFTVTADEAGEGLSAFEGRPVDDPGVVPYGTVLSNLGASGPGLRPGGIGDSGKVTRAWFAGVSQKKEEPTGAAKDFSWRECLCSDTQFYGEALEESGRSRTFVEQMPALPAGTDSVDVVFPNKTLPTIKNVAVRTTKGAKASGSKSAKVGTWTYGTVAASTIPEGWSVKQWPTPVPSSDDVAGSDGVVDVLEDVFSDGVSVEKKQRKKVEVTLDSTVAFEPDSARLTSAAKATINRIAGDVNKSATAGTTLTVEGHVSGTDKGSEAVQKKLSTDRANAVQSALEPLVTVKVKFSTVGKGATEPVAPNDSEEHRRLNRRVVVAYER